MSSNHPLRQIDDIVIRRPLVPIGEASSRLRQRLERLGVVFHPDDDPGLPGPTDTAVVELFSGTQFAFEHHHAHPGDFVLVLSERGSERPADRMDELVRTAGVDPIDIERTEDSWDVA
jgi:hypothetical protein